MSDLKEKYMKEVVPAMRVKFGYKNIMGVPRILKVVVNCGVGKLRDEREREGVQKLLALITGQKSVPRVAKKSIASFKTRAGQVIGYQVTMHGRRMYDFVGRFINITLPRTRDFRGIDLGSFDPRGNLTLGIKEHIVFPETIGEDYRFLFGLEVTIVTDAKSKKEGIELLRLMGFPIKSEALNTKS